jgi:CelD/BcsL family acetyltransferase involved in cellulose biosynthesis
MESIEWVTDRARFDALSASWDELAETEATPFLRSAWLRAWYDAFARGRRPHVAVLWRDGMLAAGLPLLAGWRRLYAPANDHTPEFCVPAVDKSARARIVHEALARSEALLLPCLCDEDPASTVLLQSARDDRRWILTEPMDTSLLVDTKGSPEEYRARLSSKVRSELGRLRRKAEREHTLELRGLVMPRDLDAQLTTAFRLEASGWKGDRRTAIISSPQTERFYRQVAREFHAVGAFRLSEMWLDGRLAAVALSLIHGRRAFTLKVAYDERDRRLGPGFILLMDMIERCFELGLEAYEFSGPDAQYERRFATGERTHRRLRIYRPDAVNAARYVYHRNARPALRAGYKWTRGRWHSVLSRRAPALR